MSGYWPVTDSLIELKTEGVTHYQYMVKVLSGAVELGQVDILLDTALMSTYLVLSCRGNTKQIFHVFWYLKLNPRRKPFFYSKHEAIY